MSAEDNNLKETLESLTTLERQICRCLYEGLSDKEIAVKLNISVRAVTYRVSRIRARLGVGRRQILIRLVTPLFQIDATFLCNLALLAFSALQLVPAAGVV